MNKDFYYSIGDVVVINEKSWTVDGITMKFGHQWVYGLNHETTDGAKEHFSCGTGSLEALMGVKKWENKLKSMGTVAS
jgi:hypothetical protein